MPFSAMAVAVLAGGAVMAAIGWAAHRPPVPRVMRSSIVLPAGVELDSDNASIELSPDGSTLAYAAKEQEGPLKLWVRPLNGLVAQPLAGTDNATYPFWSPDGRTIGFFADRKLKKVPAAGGAVQTICPAEDGRGASWGAGDVIVFSPAIFGGLLRVSASGGTPTPLTTVADPLITNRNPYFLPGGKKLLYFSGKASFDPANAVYAIDLDGKKPQVILGVDSRATYVEPGYLIFVREGNLMAQPFDPSSLRLSGEAVPIAEKVQFNANRRTGTYTVSDNGTLVYLSGAIQQKSQLTLYDLDGKLLRTLSDPAMFWFQLRVAPDDKTAAVTVRKAEGGSDLLIYDLTRGVGNRLNSQQGDNLGPVFSPDGKLVAYRDLSGFFWIRSVDGVSAPRKLRVDAMPAAGAVDWSPDGSRLLLVLQSAKTGFDAGSVSANADGKIEPILETPANELPSGFSRDGRWLAYTSDESGKSELYVTPFPGPGGKWQISTGGAPAGGWLGNGDELWYADEALHYYAVPITVQGGAVDVGARRPLFGGQALRSVTGDFTHDGKRFLATVPPVDTAGSALTLVTNWASELKAK